MGPGRVVKSLVSPTPDPDVTAACQQVVQVIVARVLPGNQQDTEMFAGGGGVGGAAKDHDKPMVLTRDACGAAFDSHASSGGSELRVRRAQQLLPMFVVTLSGGELPPGAPQIWFAPDGADFVSPAPAHCFAVICNLHCDTIITIMCNHHGPKACVILPKKLTLISTKCIPLHVLPMLACTSYTHRM